MKTKRMLSSVVSAAILTLTFGMSSVSAADPIWLDGEVPPIAGNYYTLSLRTFDECTDVASIGTALNGGSCSATNEVVTEAGGNKAVNIKKGGTIVDNLPFTPGAAAALEQTNTQKFKYSYDVRLHPDASLRVLWCATPGADYNGCRIEIGRSNGNKFLYFGKNEEGYKTPSLWNNSTAGNRDYSDWHRVETEVDFTAMTQKVKVTNLKNGNVIFDATLPEIQITHHSKHENAIEEVKSIRQVIISNTSSEYDAGYIDNLRCEIKANPVTATIGDLTGAYDTTEGYIEFNTVVNNTGNNGIFKGNVVVVSVDADGKVLMVDFHPFAAARKTEPEIHNYYDISPEAHTVKAFVWGDELVPIASPASVVIE